MLAQKVCVGRPTYGPGWQGRLEAARRPRMSGIHSGKRTLPERKWGQKGPAALPPHTPKASTLITAAFALTLIFSPWAQLRTLAMRVVLSPGDALQPRSWGALETPTPDQLKWKLWVGSCQVCCTRSWEMPWSSKKVGVELEWKEEMALPPCCLHCSV